MGLDTIAVGIDESETSANAFRWAAGLAATGGASLQALHVWQLPFVCTHPWSAPTPEEAADHARSIVRSTIESSDVGQHVESVIMRGAAGPSLVAAAATADLLVVGRTGEGLVEHRPRFGEVMAGSAARYCANHATCPIAAVNDGSTWRDAPAVVVGIDGSPASLSALTWATGQLPADATIHAVSAVTLPNTNDGAPIDYELLDPVVAEHRAHLHDLVDANTDQAFVDAGRTVHVHVVLGYARDALTDPGFPCDLIVVGEHGETGTAPGVLGSIADHTLRHASVPIIIVPAADRPSAQPAPPSN